MRLGERCSALIPAIHSSTSPGRIAAFGIEPNVGKTRESISPIACHRLRLEVGARDRQPVLGPIGEPDTALERIALVRVQAAYAIQLPVPEA